MVVRAKPATRTSGLAGRLQVSFRRRFYVLVLLVSVTVVYLWRKVETANVARQVDQALARIEALHDERSRLNAAIAFRMKPGAIQGVAVTELGMIYPSGQLTELADDMTGGSLAD
ncbi:MAG: hypothetical protein WDA75_17975 [Candidatus Latescibacterota bacterium]|jgi:hypothetical protein